MIAAVFPNFEKKSAYATTKKVCEILHNMKIEIYADECNAEYYKDIGYVKLLNAENAVMNSDIVIAIGGDGTILKLSGYSSEYDKPLLGINVGRLGFMASVETDELYNLSKLVSKDYVTEERMLLDAVIYRTEEDEECEKFTALNDICVSQPYSRLTDFNISIGGRNVSEVRADGLIFSTPTGSTAYSLSAGGPICEPTLSCIEMTPVCPQSLSSRTILFSSEHKLCVTHSSHKDEVRVSVDGSNKKILPFGGKIIISKSQKTLKLIDINGFSFFDAVNNKLMKSIK